MAKFFDKFLEKGTEEEKNEEKVVQVDAPSNLKVLILPLENQVNKSAELLAKAIKENNVLILKFKDDVDSITQQRFIDFLNGATTMLRSRIYRVDEMIFMVVSENIKVENLDK